MVITITIQPYYDHHIAWIAGGGLDHRVIGQAPTEAGALSELAQELVDLIRKRGIDDLLESVKAPA